MKEYKIAKGWAVFIYVTAPFLIGLFIWTLIIPFQNEDFLSNGSWILIPISIAMITLMVIGLIDVNKGRLIIKDDKIISISTFTNRELKIEEIKGFTVNENYIFVEPIDKQKKRIKISRYTGGYDEILNWLLQTFPDLEMQAAIEEEMKILNDENLGWSKEIREEKLIKARQVTKITNWIAGIAAAWLVFYPIPYQYSNLMAMVIPILAIIVLKFYGGLIRLDEKKGSAYPTLIYAFIYPSIALMIRALLDFEIFDYANVWLPAIGITFVFLFIILIKQQEINFKKKLDYLTVSSIVLFIFAYSFGTVIHINCYYDNSVPQYFKAKVLEKRISSGKTTSYLLKLSTWEKQTEEEESNVGKELYNETKVGDEMNIYFRKGKLEIPWIMVSNE